MKQRNPILVAVYGLLTLGIYNLVWHVKTKGEMNKLGADIPTAWLLIIPFVSYYWYWKYAGGVEKITNSKLSQILTFVLLVVLSVVGSAVLQAEFNKMSALTTEPVTSPTPDPLAAAPVESVTPVASAEPTPITTPAVAPVEQTTPVLPIEPTTITPTVVAPVAPVEPTVVTPAPAPVVTTPSIDPTTGQPVVLNPPAQNPQV